MNSGEQYRWLEKDLANIDRSANPWLVAGCHAPWYNTYKAHHKELFYSYGINIDFHRP
jgi:hypothetical protein